MRPTLAVLLAVPLAACGGGYESVPLKQQGDAVARGITYSLPETELDLEVSWTLTDCTATGLAADIAVQPTTRVVDGPQVLLREAGGISADAKIDLSFHANTARLASLGSAVADKTGTITTDVIKGATGVAVAVANAGFRASNDVKPLSGPVCTPAALRAIARAKEIGRLLPEARRRQTATIAPLDDAITSAKEAYDLAKAKATDADKYATDAAVLMAQRSFDRAAARLQAARDRRERAAKPAKQLEDELSGLQRDILHVTRKVSAWHPGRGDADNAKSWMREVRLSLAAIHGKWLTDISTCESAQIFQIGNDAIDRCTGPVPNIAVLGKFHYEPLFVTVAFRDMNSGKAPPPLTVPDAPGVLVRRAAPMTLQYCQGSCDIGSGNEGVVIDQETVPILQAGRFTAVPLVVGAFGTREVTLKLREDGAPDSLVVNTPSAGAAAAAAFAGAGDQLAKGTSAVIKAIDASIAATRKRATDASDAEKLRLDREIALLESQRKLAEARITVTAASSTLAAETTRAEDETKLYEALGKRDAARRKFEEAGGSR